MVKCVYCDEEFEEEEITWLDAEPASYSMADPYPGSPGDPVCGLCLAEMTNDERI